MNKYTDENIKITGTEMNQSTIKEISNSATSTLTKGMLQLTGRDIAEKAQVSIGTVFRVLNNKPNVDEALRERVLKVVNELGYVYTPKKRLEVRGEDMVNTSPIYSLKTVTFCVPSDKAPPTQDAYFHQILRGAQDECLMLGIKLHYLSVEDSPQTLQRLEAMYQDNDLEGIVLVGFLSSELIAGVRQLKVPLVIVDPRKPSDLEVDTVTSDSFGGGTLAMQHLIELGHRDIALLNGPQGRYSAERRLDSYQLALFKAGLPYRPELVEISTELSPRGGQLAIGRLLERNVKFSAVHCLNDYIAVGAIHALNAHGLKVPQDVSVVGYDNMELTDWLIKPLTTIDTKILDRGRVALRLLLSRALSPAQPVVRTLLNPQLVVGTTTAPYRS
jgi:LacI family transcriptional regulator